MPLHHNVTTPHRHHTTPTPGTGEVEFEDSATLDATVTATFPLGGAPTVTVKRSFGF